MSSSTAFSKMLHRSSTGRRAAGDLTCSASLPSLDPCFSFSLVARHLMLLPQRCKSFEIGMTVYRVGFEKVCQLRTGRVLYNRCNRYGLLQAIANIHPFNKELWPMGPKAIFRAKLGTCICFVLYRWGQGDLQLA